MDLLFILTARYHVAIVGYDPISNDVLTRAYGDIKVSFLSLSLSLSLYIYICYFSFPMSLAVYVHVHVHRCVNLLPYPFSLVRIV